MQKYNRFAIIILLAAALSLLIGIPSNTQAGAGQTSSTVVWLNELLLSQSSVIRNGDIRVDSAGRLHIVASRSSDPQSLFYGIFEGGAWHFEKVYPANNYVARYPSLALDSQNHPHIVYGDPGYDDLVHVWKDSQGTWQSERIINTAAADATPHRLRLDQLDQPHVVFYNGGYIDYGYRDGSGWHFERLSKGYLPDLALDANGKAAVVFSKTELIGTTYYRQLHYYRRIGPNNWTGPEVVDQTNQSTDINAQVEFDSQGKVHLAYTNYGVLKYAYKDTGWHITILNQEQDNQSPWIAIDGQNRPHIGYYNAPETHHLYLDQSIWSNELVATGRDDLVEMAVTPLGQAHFLLHDYDSSSSKYELYHYYRTEIQNQPILQVNPISLNFAAISKAPAPGAQSISIQNIGTGTLTWTASTSESWVKIAQTSGAAPANLSITIDPTAATIGNRSAFVKVTNAANSLDFKSIQINLSLTPNDPLFSQQWNLEKISIMDAWPNMGTNPVTIAVIDSGVQANHEDLNAGQILINQGWDYVTGKALDGNDPKGHGTRLAGLMAATTNNGKGLASICPNCLILPIRTHNEKGERWSQDKKEISVGAAISAAISRKAKVINLSLGDPQYRCDSSTAEAINTAYESGVVVLASSGNCEEGCPVENSIYYCKDTDLFYPARLSRVIAVGSTDQNNQRGPRSNYGTGLDLMAPGVDPLMVDHTGAYSKDSGTSFAVPQAAAVAALLLSKNPTLTPAQIDYILKASAHDLNTPGRDDETGFGLLDAAKALQISSTVGYVPAEPPAACPITDQIERQAAVQNAADLLTLYRQVRDEVLAPSPTAYSYVDLYYQNTFEMNTIILTNDSLRQRTAAFLEHAAPAFSSLLPGATTKVNLTAELYNEADGLVRDLAAAGSPEFGSQMLQVWRELDLKPKIGQPAIQIWQGMQGGGNNYRLYLPVTVR